jgi:hypothetical protein
MEELNVIIKEILLEVKSIKDAITNSNVDLNKWLDNTDVKEMLHISSRTLQRLRMSGLLKYSKLNGKIYYRQSDINEMIEKNYKPAFR